VFEFLFKYPATVFRKGNFVFASGWSPWVLVLLIVAAGVGLAWHLRRSPGRLEGRRLIAVGLLEFAALALALFLLWQPAVSIQSLRAQQNVVSIVLDTSESMSLVEDGQTRLEKARTLLNSGLVKELEEKFQVRIYGFSGSLERLHDLESAAPSGKATRIGEAVSSLLTESGAVPLGAVVVLSDGADNSEIFDRRLMAEIRQSRVPVHAVGIGRTAMPEDTEISDVNIAPRALPNSRVNAHVTIRHAGAKQQTSRLSVRAGSRVVASKNITLRRGETVQTEWVDFSAGDPGVHNLTFLLDPVTDEQILGNNSVSRVLDVPRSRRTVLYVEGEPRWEYKFIRRANDGDASVRLLSMLRTTPNKFYRQGVDDANELVKGFPDKAEDLFAYDALLIGSIEAAFFSPEQQEAIKEFVNRRGGSLLMLGGKRGLAQGGWGVSKVADVLPVELPGPSPETFVREKGATCHSVATWKAKPASWRLPHLHRFTASIRRSRRRPE
jgi:hypothetical protein